MRTDPDPIMKAAAAEISAILKKHDIAGSVVLQSADGMEYVREIAPSWSCVFFETLPNGDEMLRIRSKAEDYPSKEAQKKAMEATTGMIFGFCHQAEDDREQMGQVLGMPASHFPEIRNFIQKLLA